MTNTTGIIIAIIMTIVLIGSGAAYSIISGFSTALGIGGAIIGVCIVIALIFAGFNRR